MSSNINFLPTGNKVMPSKICEFERGLDAGEYRL